MDQLFYFQTKNSIGGDQTEPLTKFLHLQFWILIEKYLSHYLVLTSWKRFIRSS